MEKLRKEKENEKSFLLLNLLKIFLLFFFFAFYLLSVISDL